MRVLVVDGDAAAGRLVAGILAGEGVAVALARDADEAFDLLRLTAIDLLVVELVLPGPLSGDAFLRVLRDRGIGTPAIVVSDAAHDVIAAGSTLASAWLPKPISARALVETIEEVIARRSSLPPER